MSGKAAVWTKTMSDLHRVSADKGCWFSDSGARGKPSSRPALLNCALTALFVVFLLPGCATKDGYLKQTRTARADAADRMCGELTGHGTDEARLGGKLSCGEAVAIAMRRNKSLQAVRLEGDKADGRTWQSYAAILPGASLAGGYTHASRVLSFEFGGQTMAAGSPDNYTANATVYQPLFHGGASRAALNSATLGALASDAQIHKTSHDIVFAVSKAYFDVVLARQLLAVNEEALASAGGHLSDVEKKKKQGMASEFDLLRAQVEVSNSNTELVRQRNALNLARTTLFNLLGVSQESDVIMTDEPAYEETKPDVVEAVRSAFTNRPDLAQAELAVRLQKEALRAARSSFWPQADAFFNYNQSKPDSLTVGSTDWGDSWTAGINLTFSLFDGFVRRGKIKEAAAGLKQAEIQLAAAEEQALLEIKQAILSLADAEEMVKSQKTTLQQATEGLRMAESGYKAGVLTALQVTDARTALTRAHAFHYQAVYAHEMARLNLRRAMGIIGFNLRQEAK